MRGKPFTCLRNKPADDLPPFAATIESILEPVIDPLFRLRGKIGGIEEDKVEHAPYPAEEISPDNSETFSFGTFRCMGIDISNNNAPGLFETGCYGPRTRTDFEDPVPRPDFLLSGPEQEIRVRFRLVNLRGIEGHYRKNWPGRG